MNAAHVIAVLGTLTLTAAAGPSARTDQGAGSGKPGHVWAYDRCGAVALSGGCDANEVDPIFKFDRSTGKVLASFRRGMLVLPHGIHVDRETTIAFKSSIRTGST